MNDKFKEMQHEALEHLEKLNGGLVLNTPEGVLKVCEKAKAKGTWEERVAVKWWAGQWFWASYEEKYHSMHADAK